MTLSSIINSLAKILQQDGFSKRGSVLCRERHGNCQVIEVQKDRKSDRFCVNYGVTSRTISEAIGDFESDLAKSGNWHCMYRLGKPVEKWWTSGDADTTAHSMAKLFKSEGLPFIEKLTSDSELRDYWLKLFDEGMLKKTLPVLEQLLVLLKVSGPSERYEDVKETYLYVGSDYEKAGDTVRRIESLPAHSG